MISKLIEYFWPNGQVTHANEPKTETEKTETKKTESEKTESEQTESLETEASKKADPHGLDRLKFNPYDLDEVEEQQKKFIEEQAIQFFGGLAAGVYFTATEKPLVSPPPNNQFKSGNRQEFCDKLAKAAEDPRIKSSPHAIASVRVMQGQNNFQEKAGQPMPQNTIDIFLEQVYAHAALDEKAKAEGQEVAPANDHKDCDIEHHKKLQKAFLDSGYISGNILHTIAAVKDSVTKDVFDEGVPMAALWATEGPADPTCTYYKDMREVARSIVYTDSDSEQSEISDEEPVKKDDIEGTVTVVETSVEISVSKNEVEETVTVEETVIVSEYSGSFFGSSSNSESQSPAYLERDEVSPSIDEVQHSTIAQKKGEDDMDYMTRIDAMMN
ncbi:hypothetical protein [Legionella wadsworthii]|uniref:hypothetical protein n=1 Tax=Legionella wadsworthii TaxID=28088 RepID=UPI00105627EC|nr:hypothetical protein [Legionella wadsworthii]